MTKDSGQKITVLTIAALLIFGITTSTNAQDESLWEKTGIDTHGFIDARGGTRIQNDPNQKDTSLEETRLQLSLERIGDFCTIQLRSDFIHDNIPEENDLDISEGTGAIDLREVSVLFSPNIFTDVKLGRQILTWGTGDLLFINDLFPKDWQSFFIGRDVEYLKAPSDAIFVSIFPSFANIDIAYMPRFNSDRYISGNRISYWSPMLESHAGNNAVIDPDKPDECFKDDEIHIRIYKTVKRYDIAGYAYNGFWKSPMGMDPASFTATFPKLTVLGASLLGPLGSGLINLEAGYYDSLEDRDGRDPFISNSETRILAGYQREIMKNLSLGAQYYIEHMMEYDNYEASLPDGQTARDETRQVATLRLTKLAMNQNLTISFFAYYSPTDEDAYIRPIISYKATDQWLMTTGANIFTGTENHTFFGQFEKNNNIYAGAQYRF